MSKGVLALPVKGTQAKLAGEGVISKKMVIIF